MAEEKKTVTRKKPSFLRRDWHKKIKLGSTVKKNRKWRFPRGRHNKIRLGRAGHAQRPKVGWGASSQTKDMVKGLFVVHVSNVSDLENIGKNSGALIASVGLKKRKEIIAEATKKKIVILNKYKEVKEKK